MKKLFATALAALTILAVFFFLSLQPEPRTNSEPSEPAVSEASGMNTNQSGSAYTEIAPQADCPNECSSFKDDAERYTYCRTVCGFTSEEGILMPPTSTDPSLSNDYTAREDAIREHDIRKCMLITDVNIRNTCQARVAEDLLEPSGDL